MSKLTSKERLDLQKLISESDATNNTEHIRSVKHSVLIRDDIRKMGNLKSREQLMRQNNPDAFKELCERECAFLFENYFDIFNRLFRDELDLTIMTKLLTILKLIEDGRVDQHEGSVMVGKALKELYIDSAIKHGDNLDKQYASDDVAQPKEEGKKISWKDFKKMNM
jgi:hypothetical protein